MFKIVMLGDGGVGKSCLTVQLCHSYFSVEYDPTIENLYRKQLSVDDETCMVEILDTAGQEDYAAMRDQHILQGNGFGLIYSVTSKDSFQALDDFYQRVNLVKDGVYPIVLMANKCDLEKQRVVSTQDGKEWAKNHKVPFFETSAKTRFNVEEAFNELIREIKRWKVANGHSSSSSGDKHKKKCIIL